MRKLNFILKSIIVCVFISTCASLAPAQQRTFVSGAGHDANDCMRATPCRLFQRGHDAVAAGGEVVALDSAGYGTLAITKSVTISGEGVHAGMTANGAFGVSINAAGATVILRELAINGNNGSGSTGVSVTNAANVYIERCVISGFAAFGISYSTNNRLFVTDSILRSNGLDGLAVAASAGGTAKINIDRSRFEKNGANGIDLNQNTIEASITNSLMSENIGSGLFINSSGNTRANVAYSTAANNGRDGFEVTGTGANELNLEYSVARGNLQSGMSVAAGDTIRVSNSVATNNNIGFENVGATLVSRLNNTVAANTNPNVGVTTFVAQ